MGINRVPVPEKTPEELHATLSSYLEYVYTTELCFKRKTAEVRDITEAVIELVREVLKTVGDIDSRFEIGEQIFVGSMREGTRIGEPNEFDFLAVVKSLSLSDHVTLSRDGCKDGYCHIHMKSSAPTTLKNSWKDLTQNGKLQSTRTESVFWFFRKAGFREKFLEAIRHAITKSKSHEVRKTFGKLVIQRSDVEMHGPACMCMFEWQPHGWWLPSNNLIIAVDITPAIQFADISSIVPYEEVNDSTLYNHLQATGTCMCISAGKSSCPDLISFKLSFTNTEMQIMDHLSDHHRKCYRILKYLFNELTTYDDHATDHPLLASGLLPTSDRKGIFLSAFNGLLTNYDDNVIFHSYGLKTCILKHPNDGSCNENSLAKSVLEIIDTILVCLKKKEPEMPLLYNLVYRFHMYIHLPSILLPAHNIFDKGYDNKVLKANEHGIAVMKKSLDRISQLDLPDNAVERTETFEGCDIEFVHHHVARRLFIT